MQIVERYTTVSNYGHLRTLRTAWWAILYELKNLFEHTTKGCEEPNRPYMPP